MIITTTNSVEGYKIVEYKGVVFGEVVTGVNFVKDFGAGLRDFFGGRSKGYEDELTVARDESLEEIMDRAREIGANAIVGLKMDYEVLGASNSMMMVTCSGTAVIIE
ncbi:MAG: heavy metal-binding domain-containing protein [Peptoniphilaceae bacterium]|uniref:heavy metal-binding domain-containing protein n=1 Tax=Parvimonas sp. TaxID=1944660 RepID=UPI0025CEC8B5|nr:heavy metal-binding domain-containing protein [Parvimonas sp.]MCI5997098.1 heavy metal-binding domain-containing protein [Parvimonas sp.]MDD7765372.1 heavy metal-binding domain-containing protein [Peptoniphilaceae bacterium]MDY3051265.1 heavy metal-binding domain-containing protein [Parvimonas sp.]